MQPATALLFDVQRFSVHDGPGIRTTVFFKGCPLRCRWCQNPESLAAESEVAWYADRCQRCGRCVPSCPRGALGLGAERVDRRQCDGCGQCAPACALGALQPVGYRLSVDELLAQVLRDRTFYQATGGGVTLSGGEPTMQRAFVGAFVDRCRQASVSVALQTAGLFRWEDLAPLWQSLALVQYDLKVIDRVAHRRLTGVDNAPILANAARLVEARAPVEFRLPLVPGATDDEANLLAVASFLRALGVRSLALLPYHQGGEVKSARLGWPLPPFAAAEHAADPARAVALLHEHGVEATMAERGR
jgi:pyruvate formate lyase activating enzyme